MADFTAPSFSVGSIFDLDSEPQITVRKDPSSPRPARQPSTSTNLVHTVDEFGDDDFESPTVGPGPQVSDLPRTLKRLRRGPAPVAQKPEPVVSWCNVDVDDEIEEFSSQEERKCRDEPPSTQHRSLCSSSKLSLPGHGILTTQSERKRKNVSNALSSADVDTSSNKLVFPKLTVSPLRKFQLIDSDSDDPSGNDPADLDANIAGSSSKERNFNSDQHVRTKASGSMSQTEDLWNSFCSEKSFHIPTPAFDEVCDEYFRSMKDKNENLNKTKGCYESSKTSTNNAQQLNLGDHLPPAHCYFFHHGIRIQNLVCNRLPNFLPLGAGNTRGFERPSVSVIDYMGQLSHGQSSKQAAGKKNAEIRSTRSRKNSKRTGAEEVSQGSGSWVNPKCTGGIPKDAGKRRVQAVGQTAGHWYTGSNGKRVYITKIGQELTGQLAYRHYKKSQGGYKSKRSRKKTGSKKK